MSVLTKFLSETGERLRAARPEREAKLVEWKESVRALLARLAAWVREADPHGLIEIDETQSQQLLEHELGQYSVPRLEFRLDTQHVWVIPKARNVLAFLPAPDGAGERRADGQVIITDYPPRGDSLPSASYNLYLLRDAGGDRWFIRHPLEGQPNPLDRDRFEAVLVGLLR